MNISADLRKLQELESQKSSSLEEFIQTHQDEYEEEQKRVRTLQFSGWRDLPEDSLAQALIPNDLPNDYPLGVEARKATGDGNCLYNAASIVLVGNESLSPLLRLLTATELYSNAPFYVKHPKLTEAVNDCGLPEVSLFIQCLSKNRLKSWDEKMDHVAAVQREVIGGCKDGEWSCMFHVMALATVLGRPIFSAFPDCGINTRPLFQGYISPCSSNVQSTDVDAKSPAMILWSRDGSLDNRPGSWYQANHFVPLFKCDRLQDFASKKRKMEGTNEANVKQKAKGQRGLPDYFQRPSSSIKAGHHDIEKTPPGLASPTAPSKEGLGKEDISSTSRSEEKTAKEKYEEKRVREFKQHWKDEYPWVEHDPVKDIMFCKVGKVAFCLSVTMSL